MAKLEFKYLGNFEVLRDGKAVKLPPSKKTRALLAYLSLNQRQFRREFLCELLWEIPDDPRGSLRWSLSKLRRVVDDDEHSRILADRTYVEIDTGAVSIDVIDLLKLSDGDLANLPIETLEDAAERYQGNFLEGLELSNFHDFHAWCVAEREKVLRAQAKVLQQLIGRLTDEPERALPYARRLVSVMPYDEDVRSKLIRLLVSSRYLDEAEQQYRLGVRMLKEVGAESTGALFAAKQGEPGRPVQPTAPPAIQKMPSQTSSIASPGSLVGRSEELRKLSAIFDQVTQNGRAASVLVNGDPGIGKSSVLEAAASSVRDAGALLLSANGYESESLRPFGLWIDALRKSMPKAADDIFAIKGADNRDRLFDSLGLFIETEAQKRPVVLVFDDVHWCDESSANALHYIMRTNRELPLMAILAGRSAELLDNVQMQQSLRGLRNDNVLEEIDLGPLSAAAAAELIQQRAPDADSERLGRECGGNPLLAIELARAELEGDSGASLNELVRERLARLDVDGAEILRWAAVLSPHINLDTLVELSGQETERVGAVLESAERQAMLMATGSGLRFSHDLVARGVYNEISPLRRQVMHRLVAEMLEKNISLDLTHAADLAHHATQSGNSGLAARAMVSAGRLCLRFFANEEALNLARKGMQLVDALTNAERVCVSIDLHDIMFAAAPLDDWEASAREYASLAEQAVDHGELSHARLGYHMAATVRWVHGQWSDAREQSLESERVARSGDIEDQVIGLADTARCLAMLERDLPQADAMLMEASALAERNQVSHHAIPAGQGLLRFHENKLDEAEELLKAARTLCKTAGDRVAEYQANEYLVMIEFERGRYEAASTYCETLMTLGVKLREGSEGPFAWTLTGLCKYALEDSFEDLDKALAELRVVDAKYRLAYTLTRAAQLDLGRGRLDNAIERATEALEYATLLQRATEMMLAHVVLAQAHTALDNHDQAAQHKSAIAELSTSSVAKWAMAKIELLGFGGTENETMGII